MTGQMNINLSDMYIEDADALFDQLEDGFTEEQEEAASLGVESVEAEDLYSEEDEIDFGDLTEDEEAPAEEETEEEEESEEETGEEIEVESEEEADEEDSEEEVDFEEYDVTLPNGEVIKLHEAISGYKSAQDLQAEREAFEAEKETYNQTNEGMKKLLDLAKLEAQRVMDDYDGFDWATLSREDPQAYVENREFLDKYRARHKEIVAQMSQIEEQLEAERVAEVQTKASEANQILTRDIPGWNRDMYVDLMTYAVKELGMDEKFVTDSVDAGFFKAVHMAKQLATGKQTVKAKIKRIGGAPKKVVKAAPKATKQINSQKSQIKSKLESGQFDDRDLGNAFDMLED